MKPYYEHDGVTLYLGDCREVLPQLEVTVDCLVADPPYGVGLDPDWERRTGRRAKAGRAGSVTRYEPVQGDSEPFDPRPWLTYPRIVLWGAPMFAHLLPPSRHWLVWDKRDHTPSNSFSDADLAWCSFSTGGIRLFRHYWNGPVRASERGFHVHPTQKPAALMRWVLELATKPGDLVLDPYAGSGPVLEAARDLHRRAVGVELSERYCEVIARRLDQGSLFAGATP